MKVEHPGCTIKFEDGLWAGLAHGWCGIEADGAFIFKNQEEAQETVQEENWTDARVLEAWEPRVARLQQEISELKQANQISPEKLRHVRWTLEELGDNLAEVVKSLEK